MSHTVNDYINSKEKRKSPFPYALLSERYFDKDYNNDMSGSTTISKGMESKEIQRQIADNPKIHAIWKNASKEGFKYFFIYQNREEFLCQIPEEVFGVFDCHGQFVGDLLESDFMELYDKNIIICDADLLSNNSTINETDNYPTDIGNYFANKDMKDAISLVKERRTIIVFVDELK